jgi:hypothetical protein
VGPRMFRNARTEQTYSRLRDALVDAKSGDTIKVKAGDYVVNTADDAGSLFTQYGIGQNTLTIEWETPGQPAMFDISVWAKANSERGGDGWGIVMGASCLNLTVRGIHIRGYRATYTHGNAGIYALPGYPLTGDAAPAATLLVEHCRFWEHTNGIITNPNGNLTVILRNTVFQDNSASYLSHGIYASGNALLDVSGCTFKTTSAALPQAQQGHLLKSRAKVTRVRGSLFDGLGGCARLMDISNGGRFECTGNILLHYGAATFGDDNQPVRYGAEQRAGFRLGSANYNGNNNWANDGRTHSVVFAQNTVRKLQPAGTAAYEMLTLDAMTDINDAVVVFPKLVRGNVVASNTNAAALFKTTHAGNAEVSMPAIYRSGQVASGSIAGVAADASLEYVGEYLAPRARTDTNMGARAAAMPLWRRRMAPLTWVEVGSNTINADPAVNPALDATINPNFYASDPRPPWARLNHLATMLGGWCGGAWNEWTGVFWVFGGGHAGYLGNEGYSIDLTSDAPAWRRRGYPTGSIQQPLANLQVNGTQDRLPDGRPHSVHTYGLLTALPNGDVLLAPGGFNWSAGTANAAFYFRDAADDWDRTAQIPAHVNVGNTPNGAAVYDPLRNKVWHIALGALYSYDLSAGTSTRNYVAAVGGSQYWSIVRDPVHDLLLMFANSPGGDGNPGKSIFIVDPANPAAKWNAMNIVGESPWGLQGVAYDEANNRVLVWDKDGSIKTITPPAVNPKTGVWTLGTLSVSTATVQPSAQMPLGTYHRFAVSRRLNCVFGFNATTEKVFAFALS